LGDASVARAIGVDLYMIMAHGLWASTSSVQQDLHFGMLPHAAAYIFFGWSLPPPIPGAPQATGLQLSRRVFRVQVHLPPPIDSPSPLETPSQPRGAVRHKKHTTSRIGMTSGQ